MQGPGYADLDLRWASDFTLRRSKKKDEGVKATLAVDAFNVLNEVNYSSFINRTMLMASRRPGGMVPGTFDIYVTTRRPIRGD